MQSIVTTLRARFALTASKRRVVVMCLVLLIATVVTRFAYASTSVRFHQDMARDLLVIENYLDQGTAIVPYGPKASVWDFYLPPFYFQLHLIMTILSGHNPLIMLWVVTAVEAATPVVVFLILRFMTTNRLALLGAAIYVFSTTVLELGTQAWNPNMIPFCTAVLVYGVLQLTVHKKRWGVYLAVSAWLLGFQLHYQMMLVVPFLAGSIGFAWYKKYVSWKDIVLLFGIALASISSYLFAEFTSNWHNTRAIIEYFSLEHSQYYDRVSKLSFVVQFLPGFVSRVLFGSHASSIPGLVLFFLGLPLLLYQARNHKANRVLLFFFLSIFIMLRIYKGDKTDYYLSTLFMLPAVLVLAIASFKKYLGLAVALAISVVFVQQMSVKNYSNEFDSFKISLASLSQALDAMEIRDGVRLLFHTNEEINVYAYGLRHFSTIKLNPESTTVVEICEANQFCAWGGHLECRKDRSYTYVSLLKSQQKNSQWLLETPGKNYVITTFAEPITSVNYSLYSVDPGYGRSTFLPVAYNWK